MSQKKLKKKQNRKIMIEDNIYFIETPVEIQDECYYQLVEHLTNLGLETDKNIYLKLETIFNMPGKHFFNVYLQDSFNSNLNPDFLIFLQ